MNKNDIKLVLIVFITIIALFIFTYKPKIQASIANVYYKSELIKTIDLTTNKTYEVNGDNGIVRIEVNNKRIRVIQETSNYNLCSKQGYIENEGESIICLPNKIIIELPSNEIDVEVK